jgi:hypothetical protein
MIAMWSQEPNQKVIRDERVMDKLTISFVLCGDRCSSMQTMIVSLRTLALRTNNSSTVASPSSIHICHFRNLIPVIAAFHHIRFCKFICFTLGT